jgi:PAT family beta-lactamase induction signal transducer AmpG
VQYALLTSFMQLLGKYVIVPASGFMADAMGWIAFFVTSASFALPGLLVLWWLYRKDVGTAAAMQEAGLTRPEGTAAVRG